jgi:hypothetical protein
MQTTTAITGGGHWKHFQENYYFSVQILTLGCASGA